MDYLTSEVGVKESEAQQQCKASAKGKLICELTTAEVIHKHSHGWVVADNLDAQAMLLRKSEK